ncbi:MAG: nickel pincer cofactor biosynthesis protein LarB [Lachnospiraceae bacterium]|nr:nickel pincer cofactor biosynthesis protein LarB [Lachnospiraceae bacterium]
MEIRIEELLHGVKEGSISIEDAVLKLRKAPFEDIGYAKVDVHRAIRQGIAEIIYGAGKTAEQICGIMDKMRESGQETILITRIDKDKADVISGKYELKYNPEGRIGVSGLYPTPDGIGTVLIATGGTSDIPVAEEAAVTARALGNEVKCVYDVGVAGLHRLLSHTDDIMKASVIIAIAGMEGALASVIGGLADCPVIAVPTSVGYGASYDGISALLSMMNSCASGVSVVNIDNGFGAGYMASMINHMNRMGNR